jgi:hypothetical protein
MGVTFDTCTAHVCLSINQENSIARTERLSLYPGGQFNANLQSVLYPYPSSRRHVNEFDYSGCRGYIASEKA